MSMTDELPSALRDALGHVIADQRRQWHRERELLEAQSRETIALLRAENVELREVFKRDAAERLASLRDGAPGAPGRDADLAPVLAEFERVRSNVSDHIDELCRRVDARLAKVKDGEPGRDADLTPIVAEFDRVRSNVSDHIDELCRRVDARLAEVKDGEPGRNADLAPIVAEFEQVKSVLADHAGTLNRELTDKVTARLAEIKNAEIPDAPDYIAEMVSRCVAYVAHGPASPEQLPAFVLNINAGADRAKKKTIVMRKDRDGNPVADVTED